MKLSTIYRRAAEMIDSDEHINIGPAIMEAAGNPIDYMDAFDLFFKEWFPEDDFETIGFLLKSNRILALLLLADIMEGEGR